jgi:hypothetical protein
MNTSYYCEYFGTTKRHYLTERGFLAMVFQQVPEVPQSVEVCGVIPFILKTLIT